MSEFKFYMRSDNFFVAHETEIPVEELTAEKISPYIKVDGTFMYVLKTGQMFYTRVVNKSFGGSFPREVLECHFHYTNVPLFNPGDKWGFTLSDSIDTVAVQFLKFITEEINKEKQC